MLYKAVQAHARVFAAAMKGARRPDDWPKRWVRGLSALADNLARLLPINARDSAS
jgi:hypothetical protein